MMKHLLQIALAALATTAYAVPITVQQTSAADYIFSKPLLTNHIHGVLIEDGSHTYSVIRSEDVDWIREAMMERRSLFSGSLNDRIGGAKPAVGRSDAPNPSLVGTWLDGDAPLLAGCRFFSYDKVYTNISYQATFTNGVTNAFSVITMPLTNGEESVFTNSWSTQKRFPVTAVVTNIRTFGLVDYCHGVDGIPFPEYTNAAAARFDALYDTLGQHPNAKYIIAVRAALRGTVRLADTGTYWTNDVPHVLRELSYGHVETNESGSIVFEQSSFKREKSLASTAYVTTRFDSSLVPAGGFSRVTIEAVYAHGQFSHHYGGQAVFQKYFVMRLPISAVGWPPRLDLSGKKAICRIAFDPYNLCSSVSAAAGVPSPPQRYQDSGSQSWSFYVSSFVVFYRIWPSVKLPSW